VGGDSVQRQRRLTRASWRAIIGDDRHPIDMDTVALARELEHAYAHRQILTAPVTAREPGFDLDAAYQVEAELARLKRAQGHATLGRKVGYANRALWRALKLETLVWAHMYDDTVSLAGGGSGTLTLDRTCSPRLEPEIVFKLRAPIDVEAPDPAMALRSVEWMALGFEIVDSIYADWTFQPPDFVAAYGLHAALVVGHPHVLETADIPALVEQLAAFRVRLLRNGSPVAEGSGRTCLRSPAICLGVLAAAIAKRTPDEPLAAGELVSSGTLTEPQPIARGETWTASVEGLPVADLTLRMT
jgi:2-oxo-3-hexenedioate decarboxylase